MSQLKPAHEQEPDQVEQDEIKKLYGELFDEWLHLEGPTPFDMFLVNKLRLLKMLGGDEDEPRD